MIMAIEVKKEYGALAFMLNAGLEEDFEVITKQFLADFALSVAKEQRNICANFEYSNHDVSSDLPNNVAW